MRKALIVFALIFSFTAFGKGKAPASEVGRYEVIVNPQSSLDVMLLDTVTGQIWKRYISGEGDSTTMIWVPMTMFNTQKEYWEWFKKIEKAKK